MMHVDADSLLTVMANFSVLFMGDTQFLQPLFIMGEKAGSLAKFCLQHFSQYSTFDGLIGQ